MVELHDRRGTDASRKRGAAKKAASRPGAKTTTAQGTPARKTAVNPRTKSSSRGSEPASKRSSGAGTATRRTRRRGRGITTAEERERLIAESAYYRAERRGFEGGDPLQDWLEAEAEVDALLLDTKTGKP